MMTKSILVKNIKYPADIELILSIGFLNIALGNMLASHSFPVREILDVMTRIRVTAPKAKEIWERSALSAGGLWDILAGVGRQEKSLRSMLEQGEFTLDTCVGGIKKD